MTSASAPGPGPSGANHTNSVTVGSSSSRTNVDLRDNIAGVRGDGDDEHLPNSPIYKF